MLAALPCVGLLLALFWWATEYAESSHSGPATGPFFLVIGLCITVAGIAWSRAEPVIDRHEASYWASVNRSR